MHPFSPIEPHHRSTSQSERFVQEEPILRLCCFLRLLHSHDLRSEYSFAAVAPLNNQPETCDHCAASEDNYGQYLFIYVPGHSAGWSFSRLTSRTRLLLAASRLPKSLQTFAPIPDAVRSFLKRKLAPSPSLTTSLLIAGAGMTLHNLTLSVAAKLRTPTLQLWSSTLPGASSVSSSNYAPKSKTESHLTQLEVEPCASLAGSTPVDLNRVAMELATEVFVAYVTPKGKTFRAAMERLNQPDDRFHLFVWIPNPDERRLNPALRKHMTAANHLMDHGAIGWYLQSNESEASDSGIPLACPTSGSDRWVSAWKPDPVDTFLYHHTRACPDAWPEQTDEEYWWRWLFRDAADQNLVDVELQSVPDPLQTLLRIATQRRLRASGRLIPGSVPMICFSARPPDQSVAQRQFRRHLHRWDYEPFGLAIVKEKLVDLGTQAVHYWDPDHELQPPSIAPEWTQKRFSRHSSGPPLDWSTEREHRLAGDLDLERFSPEQLYLFVSDRQQALELARYSRWPVKYFS